MQKDILDADRIRKTLNRLCLRIEDRFPDSGLLGVARTLAEVARETDEVIRWIRKPRYLYRLLGVAFVAAVIAAMAFAFNELEFESDFGITEFVSLTEAAINELILISAAVIFILTAEVRQKRKRVIAALNQLRSIAHVIDAHQLTKDPDVDKDQATRHSPRRNMTPYQLERYLDYCTELLSLNSKIAFLYVQWFDDPIALNAANDIENLGSSLSAKIWQKIVILDKKLNA